MNRTPVKSFNIASVGYDTDSSVLEVEFHSGSVYQYFDVPELHFRSLTNGTGSAGKYLNQQVKGRFTYRRVS